MKFLTIKLALMAAVLSGTAIAKDLLINGSSQAAMQESMRPMMQGLDATELEIFQNGFLSMVVTTYPPAKGLDGLALIPFMEPAMVTAHNRLDGISFAQIMERGRALAKHNEAQANQQKAQSKVAKKEYLAKVDCMKSKILLSKPSLSKTTFGHRLDFTVSNGLQWALGGIVIRYKLASSGREVPWEKGIRPIVIKGGIEPGETRSIHMTAWEVPKDAPDKMEGTISMYDVADGELKLLFVDDGYLDFSNIPTSKKCQ